MASLFEYVVFIVFMASFFAEFIVLGCAWHQFDYTSFN